MNSCKSWHCCCHTIIPKRRRQENPRHPTRSPIKTSKIEDNVEHIEMSDHDPPADFLNKSDAAPGGGLNGHEFGSGNSSTSNSDEELNGDDAENSLITDDRTKEAENDTTANDNHKGQSTTEESGEDETEKKTPSATTTEAEDEAIEDHPPDDEEMVENGIDGDYITIDESKNKSDLANEDERTTNESSIEESKGASDSKKSDIEKVKPAVVTPKLTAAVKSSVKASATKTPVNKSEPQPSTSTGSSTGRYNCRNREKFHKCLKCGKMFFQLDSFERHEKEHMLEETKPCYCTVCNKSYTSLSSFSRHLKTHVTCSVCSKTFSQWESLKASPGGTNYYCSDCKKISSPPPPVLKPEGPFGHHQHQHTQNGTSTKGKSEIIKVANHAADAILPRNAAGQVVARKSAAVLIPVKTKPSNMKITGAAGNKKNSSPLAHKKGPYAFLRCGTCNKRFPNRTTLKSHQTIHTTIS